MIRLGLNKKSHVLKQYMAFEESIGVKDYADRNRTCDLQVMSLASYLCSTAHLNISRTVGSGQRNTWNSGIIDRHKASQA